MPFDLEPVDYNPFAEDNAPSIDDAEGLSFEPVDFDPFQDENPDTGYSQPTGALGAFAGGVKNTIRNLGSAADVVTGDDQGVMDSAAQAMAAPNVTPAQEDFRAQLAAYGDPDGVWDAIKNVARAAWNEPKGALHETISQLPNSGVILGTAGSGAAIGTMLGGPVGTLVGGIGGLFLGNTSIETGAIANEMAMEGRYDRGQALQSGVIKGGVITAVDTATLGLTKWLTGTAGRAATQAVNRTLAKHGIDIADDAAVKVALQNKQIFTEAARAGKEAAAMASTGWKNAGRHVASFAGEVVGEGVGEYAGSAMAPGIDADLTDAVLESLMSGPQSIAEVGIGKSLNLLDKGPVTDAAQPEFIDEAAVEDQEADPSGQFSFPSHDDGTEAAAWEEQIREQQSSKATGAAPVDPVDEAIRSRHEENQAQMERMAAPPAQDLMESKDLLSKNVEEFRRIRSIERSEDALGRRQHTMGQADQPVFQRGLEGRPDETSMAHALPGEIPAFQRGMESSADGGRYTPFAGLGDMMAGAGIEPETLPEQALDRYDDGIDVSTDAEFVPIADIDQEAFQSGLANDDFGAQDLPAEVIARQRPIFEHEVEPDKVETDPSDAQKEAGNYRKDHIKIDGHQITIENPDGSTRKGRDRSGKEWESKIHGHYGYFKRTMGKDGDQVDVFIKPGTETSPKVFVVDQVDPNTGRFDEHKVMFGYSSAAEAEIAYLSNYEPGWQGLGEITQMDQAEFKDWVKDGTRTKKPLAISPQGGKPGGITFAAFEKKYRYAYEQWMKYSPDQVGSRDWAEKMSDLEEAYPEWSEMILNNQRPKGDKAEDGAAPAKEAKPEKADKAEEATTTLQPGTKVQYTDKKGNTITGTIQGPAKKNWWKIEKDDGGTTMMPGNKLEKYEKTGKPDDSIGKNSHGQKVYEDENGVRSYEISPGFLSTQPVSITPGKASTFDSPEALFKKAKIEFLTKDEAENLQSEYDLETESIRKAASEKDKKQFESEVADAVKDSEAGTPGKDQPSLEGKGRKLTEGKIISKLEGDGFKNITHARKFIADLIGVDVIKPGTIEAKDVDELIEVAAVEAARKAIKDARKNGLSDEDVFDFLARIQGNMPNLSVRTSTSVMNQAYSTPLTLAWVASSRAGLSGNRGGEVVFEPAAGNGALLIGTSGDDLVFANELNPDRERNLRSVTGKVIVSTTEDGTEYQPKNRKASVVIANPPFGIVKDDDGKTRKWQITDQYETSQIDHAMVFNALEAMKDNGRAVFIIGSVKDQKADPDVRKRLYRAKDKVRFYKSLFDRYNVTDIFTMAGDLYKKQGAGWPVDVIVIDGKGKSSVPLPGADTPRYIDSLERLKEQLHEKSKPHSMDIAGAGEASADGGNGKDSVGGYAGQGSPQASPGGPVTGTDKSSSKSRPGGKQPGKSPGGSGVAGRDDGQKSTDGSKGPSDGEPKVSGVSEPDRDTVSEGADNQDKPSSGKDPEGRKGNGAADVSGQPDTSVEDEFSPENLLAEWDRQAEEVTAKEKAQEAKQHFSNAIDKFKQINALLGERGSFSTEPTDENIYQEIRILLQEALDEILAAGKSAKDFVKLSIENLSKDARPYFERFVKNDMVVEKPKPQAKPAKKKPQKPANGTDSQAAYVPASKSSAIGTLTPVNMATASKKALDKIKESHGSVDKFVAKELGYTLEEINGKPGEFGYFSGEQVDAIALAIHNIGNGAGFIIGDQTGVGKGRVVAAMQRYAMKKGLTPIFVTEKPNLYTDMYRDFVDIGMADMADKILITNSGQKISLTEDGSKVIRTKSNHNALLNKIAGRGTLPAQYKTIFTTYDQLNITGSPRRRFISEMVKRRGMLIMDESHNAGGTEGAKSTNNKIPRSVYFRELVRDAHSVFYSSATYAKRPGIMDLYAKTDMRLAVDNVADIGGAILQGGVPLQQAVASMLVEAGQYVRRERSFDGVEYRTKSVEIDKVSAEKIADALAEIKAFSDNFAEPAIEDMGDEGAASGVGVYGDSAASAGKIHSVGFSSIMHNLISQMLLSMKTEGAIQEAIAAHKAGMKPVITVANTMGSFIEQYAEKYDLKPGDGIGLQFNDLIDSYLEKTRHYTISPPFAKKKDVVRKYVTDAQLGEVGVEEFKRIRKKIQDLDLGSLPVSPVDYIIHRLEEAGIRTSEITGRTDRIKYRTTGTDRYTKRPGSERSVEGRTKTIYEFNTDKLGALILNKSGSTGLSLHAVPKYGGHKPAKRHMIILQAEANIDTHMQMLGRVHRAGQVVAPTYTQLMGDIPSEKRPAAVLAAKMASLNANTTAAKDSDLTARETVDFMNKYGDRVTAGLMADFPELHEKLGRPLGTDSRTQSGLSERGAAKKVTGRIPLLPLKDQDQLYEMLESSYTELVEQLNATGENDLEAKTFDTDARILGRTTVFDQTGLNTDSPFTSAAVAEQVDMKKLGKSYTGKEVVALLTEYAFDMNPSDAKAAGKSLEEIYDEADKRHEDQKSEALNRFIGYQIETVDDISDENRARAMEERLAGIREDWEFLHGTTRPGSILEVKVGEDYQKMVVLKVHQVGSPKNPLALGTWKVTFAVPDSMRRVTYPFSYLNNMEPTRPGFSKAAFSGVMDKAWLSRFDYATRSAREERTIITGNLLAAYGRYHQGRIINFTTSKGDVRQGVLMPADFDLEQAEKGRPIFLNNHKDIVKVLKEGVDLKGTNGDIKVFTGVVDEYSGRFQVERGFDKPTHIQISVPASKAGGSKYYLGRDLLRAIPREFVKSKNRMVTILPIAQASKAFDVLVNKMDEPFQNTYGSEVVRETLGIEGIAFDNSSKFSTTDDVQTPGQGVTLKGIQSRFKGQQVFLGPDGAISIRMDNGQGLTIKNVKEINPELVEMAMRAGRMEEDGEILGHQRGRTITLHKDLASNFTRDHELWHFLKRVGMVDKKDSFALASAMNRMKADGRLTFKVSKSKEENEANTFAQVLAEREWQRDKTLGRLVQKIMDFIDGLWYIGRQSARKLAREVESGKIFGRQAKTMPVYEFAGVRGRVRSNATTPAGTSVPGVPHVETRETGKIQVPRGPIRTPGEIAGIFPALSGAAQEEVWAVTTDNTGEIIEVHRFSKGMSDAADAHVNQMTAHLLNNDRADIVYVIHNHPSGVALPSGADHDTAMALQASLRLKSIKTKGIIIADGKFGVYDERDAEIPEPLKPIPDTKSVPVVERRIVGRSPFKDFIINEEEPITQMRRFDGEKDGVLLADGARREIAFIPFAKGKTMRQATIDLLTKAAKHNAVFAAINAKNLGHTNRWKFYGRLAGGLSSQGIRVLDFITEHPATGPMSLREEDKHGKNNMYPDDAGSMNALDSDEVLFSTSDDIISEKFHSRGNLIQRVKETIADEKPEAMDRAIAKTVDSLHFVKKRLGDEAYKLHRMLTGVKSASFSMFLEHGKLSWDGNALTVTDRNQGVLPFLRSIGDDWQNLFYWVAAKRAEQLEKEGRENWLKKADRDAIFAKVGTHSEKGQSWAVLNSRFQEFNKNILDVMEQAGLIDPESRVVWESNVYIPFYRIMEDDVTRQEFLSGPRKSRKHISAQIKQLKGGQAKIGDPLENILMNWMHGLDAAARNKARAKAFEVGQAVDIIEEVPKKELSKILGAQTVTRYAVVKDGKTRARNIFDTREEADAWAYDLNDKGKGPYAVEPRKETRVIFGSMKDYGILSFQKNGRPVYFRTEDPDLYEALSEVDTAAFNNIFMRMMGGAKRLLSYGATFGPAFRIRNMIRDTVHTAVVAKSFRPFVDTGIGFLKSMREDAEYIEFMASGFGFGSSYVNSDDPETGARFIKRIVRQEGKGAVGRILTSPSKILAAWEKIGTASENAARLGLYRNLKKEGVSTFDAGFEGRDLMDFSMRGNAQSVQMLTRIVPFLNARVQGLYKLGRAARENPRAFLIKSAMLTAASLALWSLFKDDDRYKDLEDWDKWTYFHFWLGDDHYRIPKPFEIGALFSSLPESVANVMNGTEEGAFVWNWFLHTARDVFNVDMPQLFKPVVEERFNLNTFKGRPVVPDHMEKLKPSEQYHPWTSDTMRVVGGAMNISPIKLEHYVNGYFSTIGMMVLSGIDVLSREAMGYPARPADSPSPFDLRVVEPGGSVPRSTKNITRFYDLYKEVETANATMRHFIKTGQVDNARKFLMENRGLLSLKTPVYRVRQVLSEINREIKRVQRSRKMSPGEKRDRIEKLNSAKAKITKTLFQKIKSNR